MTAAKTAILIALMILAPHASWAEETRWPWYGEWEQSRFAAFSPLIQSLIKRDEAEAVRLIESGAGITEMVSEHEITKMVAPNVKTAYVGGEPERDYPLVILAAVAKLPRVITAIGKRSPATLAATDPEGNTALAWASRSGHADVVKILLEHGGDPLLRDKDNNSPMTLAVKKKYPEVVRLLIAAVPVWKYGDIGVMDQVWVASYLNDTATMRALVEANVPVGYIAPQGNTALISAVMDVNLERVRLLLDHGATVDHHSYRGQTIFEIAEAKLARDTDDAREIHRLINAAPRQNSGWKKPAEGQRMDFWKTLNPPRD